MLLRSDGAGCFNSILQRSCQVLWGTAEGWGDIFERSLRISISGAGKDELDSLFGVIGRKMLRYVNTGQSYFDAATIAAAIGHGAGLSKVSIAQRSAAPLTK